MNGGSPKDVPHHAVDEYQWIDDDCPGLRADLGDSQLVDVVQLIGTYFMIARISTVFEVAADLPRTELLAAARTLDRS